MDQERIRLMIQGDDFGMCHSVNRGIVEAFTRGVLTQAMLMAPCPWFKEAVSLAHVHRIPIGLHCTLTAEWDHLRWGPLTDAPSLVESDGTFHRTVEAARLLARPEEAARELLAQAARLEAEGLSPIHIDAHMGLIDESIYEVVSRQLDRAFLYPLFDPSLSLQSFAVLSTLAEEEKTDWLIAHLEALEPGTHLLQTHPATASAELRGLTDADSPLASWAEPYRVSDLTTLVDPHVREAIVKAGIELISAESAPRHADARDSRPRLQFTME